MESKKKNEPKQDWKILAVIGVFVVMIFLTMAGAVILPNYLDYDLQNSQLSRKFNYSSIDSTSSMANKTDTIKSQIIPLFKPDSSKIFEAYGRLLTLLATLISVIAIFFGYFVHKSIREAERDMDERLEKRMKEINDKIQVVEKMEKQYERMSRDYTDKMKQVEKILVLYNSSPTADQPDSLENLTASLDDQLEGLENDNG